MPRFMQRTGPHRICIQSNRRRYELERSLFPEFPLRVCLFNIWANLIMLSDANKNVGLSALFLHWKYSPSLGYVINDETYDVCHHGYIKCTIFEYTQSFKIRRQKDAFFKLCFYSTRTY